MSLMTRNKNFNSPAPAYARDKTCFNICTNHSPYGTDNKGLCAGDRSHSGDSVDFHVSHRVLAWSANHFFLIEDGRV